MPWFWVLLLTVSFAWADTAQQWAPASGVQPKSGATPPPSSIQAVTSANNKKIYIIGKTSNSTPPSATKPPPSTLPEFHSDNPYEILSASWRVQLLSESSSAMADLRPCPGLPTSLACFSGPGAGNLTLICTHKLGATPISRADGGDKLPISPDLVFDKNEAGCCTRLVINETTGLLIRQEVALLGLHKNGAGCPTPWGSFLTGESLEDSLSGSWGIHGRLFEVNPLARGLVAPLPIDLGGPISIGALYADNATHSIYISESRDGGVLYRFKPEVWTQPQKGGRLAVLGYGKTLGLLDSSSYQADRSFHWITLPSNMQDPHEMALRMGGAPLGSSSGMSTYMGDLFISLPCGGIEKKGQILRIGNGKVSILEESRNNEGIRYPGNIYIDNSGEMLVCETRREGSRLMLRSQGGGWKPILWVKDGPVGGVAVSPDNRAVFVNLQSSDRTVILWRKD